jgi:hypothetical protein
MKGLDASKPDTYSTHPQPANGTDPSLCSVRLRACFGDFICNFFAIRPLSDSSLSTELKCGSEKSPTLAASQ